MGRLDTRRDHREYTVGRHKCFFRSTIRRLFSFVQPFILTTRRFHRRNVPRGSPPWQKKVAFCIESLEGAALDNIAVGSRGDRKESREIPLGDNDGKRDGESRRVRAQARPARFAPLNFSRADGNARRGSSFKFGVTGRSLGGLCQLQRSRLVALRRGGGCIQGVLSAAAFQREAEERKNGASLERSDRRGPSERVRFH